MMPRTEQEAAAGKTTSGTVLPSLPGVCSLVVAEPGRHASRAGAGLQETASTVSPTSAWESAGKDSAK